jgi:colanic acid/amylovoran biosynthesis glycosyltransferase
VLFRSVSKVAFQEVIDKIGRADLLLLPSVEEGIANVVLEAMAVGTLVISTDCGGMKEVVEHKKNGFIVPVRNPQAMAEIIRHVQQLSSSEKERMVVAARETIEILHTEKNMIEGIRSLYTQVYEQRST